MFECGVSLGVCQLLLAMFDLTSAIPCIGNLVGNSIKDRLGIREGAVESPHQFNMYVAGLRQRLADEHPRLCRLLHLTIAVLMYADDAALPTDSEEDMRLSAQIFERVCNDHRLFISVPKTMLTVFHHEDDTDVV